MDVVAAEAVINRTVGERRKSLDMAVCGGGLRKLTVDEGGQLC